MCRQLPAADCIAAFRAGGDHQQRALVKRGQDVQVGVPMLVELHQALHRDGIHAGFDETLHGAPRSVALGAHVEVEKRVQKMLRISERISVIVRELKFLSRQEPESK